MLPTQVHIRRCIHPDFSGHTPKAANVAEQLCDVERVDLCDYFKRARLLLDLH